MLLVLTDLLICPKCGPGQGLIVLAERIEERRVLEGTLGCPICETHYPIRDGVADLRSSGPPAGGDAIEWAGGGSDPVRIAALLGITQGPGFAVILGVEAEVAGAVSALVPGLELIVVDSKEEHGSEKAGVSRLQVTGKLPLRSGSMRAALVGTGVLEERARDALRVVAIGARIVLSTAYRWVEEWERQGLVRVVARDAAHVVTIRLG
jgi:uncharacterized protein YbaR (Trm112 family)